MRPSGDHPVDRLVITYIPYIPLFGHRSILPRTFLQFRTTIPVDWSRLELITRPSI